MDVEALVEALGEAHVERVARAICEGDPNDEIVVEHSKNIAIARNHFAFSEEVRTLRWKTYRPEARKLIALWHGAARAIASLPPPSVSTSSISTQRRLSDADTPFRAQARARSSGSLRTGARRSRGSSPTPPSYMEPPVNQTGGSARPPNAMNSGRTRALARNEKPSPYSPQNIGWRSRWN